MLDSRCSDNEVSRRDIPSFIEPRPPLVSNPFMRPRPQKRTNLLELFEEDSECEETELVQVYLRLKPCNTVSNLYEVRSDRYLITSLDTTTAGHGRRTQHNVSKMYTFTHIFGSESNQKELFEQVVKDNLKKLPEGNSFTLLTYGASGSGKTFTLMGTVAAPGLVPRSLEYVFKVVKAAQTPLFKPSEVGAEKLSYAEQDYELQWVKRLRQISAPLRDRYRRMSAQLHGDLTSSNIDLSSRTRHYVWVSFIEIYNEGIYDLLAADRRTAAKLAIREDSNGNVYVKGASQAFVRSGEEAYDIMVAGKHNLQVAATGIHAQSSRSHCIFTITMLTETSDGVRSACVRLCDLAGCERAARTRNTGARMHESRAINSSLHVLERCLRMLRRRRGAARAALVPYRESKLTRLLGAGLSGARGEAVSMVVTLNPAPDCAHETRHVLQLAAVARDIQINNTISDYPSSLESSEQDSTFACSPELMQLRADNERLHFELIQAHARNKELLASMEQRQAEAADTMRELVEEAKEISRQFYEERIRVLRTDMEEMTEEYESKLSSLRNSAFGGSPSKLLQNKITQLMTEITLLEEHLQAERLARARAEEEVQHLRACIDERDEKCDDQNANEDLVSLTDSENSEDESDPCNESLEPTFRKEDINRSRMIRQSLLKHASFTSECSENSVLNVTSEAIKEDQTVSDCTYDTGEDTMSKLDSIDSIIENDSVLNDDNINYSLKEDVVIKGNSCRITYSVNSPDSTEDSVYVSNDSDDRSETKKSLNYNKTDVSKDSLLETDIDDVEDVDKKPSTFVNKIISCIRESKNESNNSLAQFECLELAANAYSDKEHVDNKLSEFKAIKEKINYSFEEPTNKSPKTPVTVVKSKERKIYFDNIDVSPNKRAMGVDLKIKIDDYRSPSIVRDDVANDFEPTVIKKLLGESITRQAEAISAVHKLKIKKKCESIDMFEGLDSPKVDNVKNTEVVETVRKCINNLAITAIDAKIEINVERESILRDKEDKEVYFKSEISPEDNVLAKSSIKIKAEKVSPEIAKFDDDASTKVDLHKTYQEVNEKSQLQNNTKTDNTIEEFENIFKDISEPRCTEFDLLVSQDKAKLKETINNQTETDELKYNLRHQTKSKKPKTDIEKTKSKNLDYEIQMESVSKCESKPNKRNLRLRRRKNQSEEEEGSERENKLKDIANLQTEYSDVTLDVAVPVKESKDIPSPEKQTERENVPPTLGIQSCPSKSVLRSRRKLFTPLAEPLEESMSHVGNSDERVYVPRPSYHRPRARRKL